MALYLSTTSRPQTPIVEFDDYIPVQIQWVTPGAVRPIYYRCWSPDGGDLELKLEPLTGELVGLVLNDIPPLCGSQIADDLNVVVAEAQARFNTAGWDLTPDRVPRKSLVREELQMCSEPDGDGVKVRLSHVPAAKWLRTNAVAVGVSVDAELVCVRVPMPLR